MSLIRKKSELVYRPKIKMLIYGSAGAGKTTLALSAPKPLLLDCDNGVHRVNYDHQTDTLQVENYPQVLEVLTKEDLTPYETIVIDTGGKLLDFMAEYIIANNPKMGKANGTLTLQGFGARKVEFQAFCKLVSSLNKHLVFVAHRKSQTENDDKVRYVPLFGGSNYDDLVTELDLVGYLELDGRRRVITFDPTDRNDGKNTCNLPSMIELPVTVDEQGHGLENTFITDGVIKPYCERIAAIQEQGKKYDKLIADFAEGVAKAKTPEDVNGLIAVLKTMEHIGSSEVKCKTMIADRAKALGFVFDKAKKGYVNQK
jgi:hypothetical protein